MTPYLDEDDAQDYFDERLAISAWTAATTADQVKALKMATKAIDRLSFTGEKNDAEQEHQFPRGDDTEVPQDILDATCELALALLDGVDPNLEIEVLSQTQGGIEGARVSRDTSYVQPHIRAGIPSIQAWTLLLPFLRDPNDGDLSRA